MSEQDLPEEFTLSRDAMLKLLTHVRNAMTAYRYNFPAYPPMRAAEEMLLLTLFGKEETKAYYDAGGGGYAPFPDK